MKKTLMKIWNSGWFRAIIAVVPFHLIPTTIICNYFNVDPGLFRVICVSQYLIVIAIVYTFRLPLGGE